MGRKFKMDYFKTIYDRYQRASRELKGKILDEFCKICGYNRKYATSKLNDSPPEDKAYSKQAVKRRRPFVYSNQAVKILIKVWEAAGYPCSLRLKQIIKIWLPWIEKHFCPDQEIKQQLLLISPRQMDRRLQKHRQKAKHRLYGRTKPGTLLKHHIPIKTDHWDVKEPGFTEVDTVSHSGSSADGTFAYSLNQTDILTGWVETMAILGKGEKNVISSLDELEKDFPFPIKGIDADNGGEFINHHLFRRCETKKIQLTRGRPYKKDDNAHIEQKNWTHVRKLMGWSRYDTQAAVDLMNDLYKNELHLFMNLFMPSVKLIQKQQLGSKHKRRHDQPATPLDRLIASGKGNAEKINYYKSIRQQTDPFELSKRIDEKLQRIYNAASHRQAAGKPCREKTVPAKAQNQDKAVLAEVSKLFGMTIRYPGGIINPQG